MRFPSPRWRYVQSISFFFISGFTGITTFGSPRSVLISRPNVPRSRSCFYNWTTRIFWWWHIKLLIRLIDLILLYQKFTITPHYAHRWNGLCAILPPKPQFSTSYPLKTAQNGSDDFWGYESLCRQMHDCLFRSDPIEKHLKKQINHIVQKVHKQVTKALCLPSRHPITGYQTIYPQKIG